MTRIKSLARAIAILRTRSVVRDSPLPTRTAVFPLQSDSAAISGHVSYSPIIRKSGHTIRKLLHNLAGWGNEYLLPILEPVPDQKQHRLLDIIRNIGGQILWASASFPSGPETQTNRIRSIVDHLRPIKCCYRLHHGLPVTAVDHIVFGRTYRLEHTIHIQ